MNAALASVVHETDSETEEVAEHGVVPTAKRRRAAGKGAAVPTPRAATVTTHGAGAHGTTLTLLNKPDYDVNIGLHKDASGWQRSKWLNPFPAGAVGDAQLSLQLYKDYIRRNHKRSLPELAGKKLGLWLRDGEPNYGVVLLELLDELYPQDTQPTTPEETQQVV